MDGNGNRPWISGAFAYGLDKETDMLTGWAVSHMLPPLKKGDFEKLLRLPITHKC